jgi:hypothetical protein
MKESALEKKIVRYCRESGIYCRKFRSANSNGVPDRFLAKDGLVMFLELKAPGNKPTPLQRREIDILHNHGISATWADNYQSAVEIIADHFAGRNVV